MANILVIDDDEQVRSVIKQILEVAGYAVSVAQDGTAGFVIHQQNPADLVITDIIMPEEGGLATIMKFKRDYPKTKIIAISGGGKIVKVDFLSMAKNLGAFCALQKPIGREELLKAVGEALALAKE